MDRFEIKSLPKRVEEELALGEEILREISNRRRGNLANMTFIDDSPFELDAANVDVEISLEKAVEFPKEQSNTIGFIRVNGVEYPIIGIESTTAGFGRNDDGDSWQAMEWEDCEGNYREPTLDSFSQLRPGYKGGNTPNLFKSCEPCSRVNPKDVAKRRAKNKAARKNKRK